MDRLLITHDQSTLNQLTPCPRLCHTVSFLLGSQGQTQTLGNTFPRTRCPSDSFESEVACHLRDSTTVWLHDRKVVMHPKGEVPAPRVLLPPSSHTTATSVRYRKKDGVRTESPSNSISYITTITMFDFTRPTENINREPSGTYAA